jgi:hypothetical protein
MIATYPAYLTPDGRVDWRGEAPNAETLAAMEDAVLGRNLSGPFKSAEDMLADILKED